MRALLCVVFGLGPLAACAGGPAAGASAPWNAANAPDVTSYDTAETPHPVLDARSRAAPAAALAHALQSAAHDAGLSLRGDGRLGLLAQRLVYEPAADARSLAASARAFGVVEVEIEHRIVRSTGREPLANAAAKQLSKVLRELQATHFGAFIAPDGNSASIVVSRRPFVLTQLARKAAPGATLTVNGRVAAGLRDPRLVVTSSAGVLTLPAGEGPDFDLRVPTRTEGEYRLSLQATAGDAANPRRQTLAELVMAVGTAPRVASDAQAAVTDAQSAAARIAQGLYARAAAQRAHDGLTPLQTHAGLQRRAERMSQAVADGGSLDDSPQNGGLVLRATARGSDEQGLWDALVSDPAQRARLQSPDVSHLGIGVVRTTDGFIATEVWAQLTQLAFDDLAPARVLSALNHNRGARGAQALRPDAQLTRVANDAAREFFAHPERSEREIMQRANDALANFGLSYGRVTALAVLVADPDEAASLEPALDLRARAVGVAVTRGERPDGVPGGVAVVLTLGYDR